jgi:hypothetical protein
MKSLLPKEYSWKLRRPKRRSQNRNSKFNPYHSKHMNSEYAQNSTGLCRLNQRPSRKLITHSWWHTEANSLKNSASLLVSRRLPMRPFLLTFPTIRRLRRNAWLTGLESRRRSRRQLGPSFYHHHFVHCNDGQYQQEYPYSMMFNLAIETLLFMAGTRELIGVTLISKHGTPFTGG